MEIQHISMIKRSAPNFGTILFKFTITFFCLSFLSRTFTIHRTVGEGGGYLFNSCLPLLLTSAHSSYPDTNREPLVSERKLLTTKLRIQQMITTNGYILFDYS